MGARARGRRFPLAVASDARPRVPVLPRPPPEGLRVARRREGRAGGAREPDVRPRGAERRDSLRKARGPRGGNPARGFRSCRARGRQLLGGRLRGARSLGGALSPRGAEDSRRSRSGRPSSRRRVRGAPDRAPLRPRRARGDLPPRGLDAAGAVGGRARPRRGPRARAGRLRASRAAGRFVFVRAYGAVNLWLGNDPASGGVQNARPNGPWDRVAAAPARAGVAPAGEEAYFTRRTLARAKDDPAGFARVVLSKLVWLTQAEEPRDNLSFAFFAAQSGILRVLPGFGLLLSLAAAAAFVRPPAARRGPASPVDRGGSPSVSRGARRAALPDAGRPAARASSRAPARRSSWIASRGGTRASSRRLRWSSR